MTNLQISPRHVVEKQSWTSKMDGAWTPAIRTIRVSSFYSLTQCNLEFTRSIEATGGSVVHAVENGRSTELRFDPRILLGRGFDGVGCSPIRRVVGSKYEFRDSVRGDAPASDTRIPRGTDYLDRYGLLAS